MKNNENSKKLKEENSKKDMFVIKEMSFVSINDSICPDSLLINNKYDFIAFGGRKSKNLFLFCTKMNDFKEKFKMPIFKSEPTNIVFHGNLNQKN